MNFWDKLFLHKTKIYAIIAFIVMFYWLSISDDDTDQPIITVKERCDLALKHATDLSKNVVEHCKKLLKEENEIE